MIRDDVQLDLTFALGEIQDIRGELETKLDPLAERLEGIEIRLKELTDALYEYAGSAASNPHAAGESARRKLWDARILGAAGR